MGYRGQTHGIDFARGGFSFDQNIDKIPITAMVEGTKNINLHKGGRSKRGGTSHVNGTVITGTPRIWGLYQFRLQNGTEFILTATSDGKIQKNYNTELKTGLTIDRPVHFITFNNMCVICTGNDLPQIWDGAAGSTTDIVNEATDWAGGNYPRKMIIHGRGASERLWAINGKTDPNTVYASAENPGDGSTEPDFVTGVLTFYIDTGDGHGIVNGAEYGDRIILAGKSWTYIIDDTDSDTSKWGYNKAQWGGGTATDKTFVQVTNDIISMTEDGTVYSVTAAQNYGDYKQATLTRASFIDEYIREKMKLSAIGDFHVIYDPVLRCINFFVIRANQTDIDTALVYFIDRGPEEGWVIKDNINSDSGFKASCSALVRKAVGDFKIYTGGMGDGYVWELETSTHNDNSAAYSSGFKTPRGHLGDPRVTKRFDQGRILVDAKGPYNLLVDFWVDGSYVGQETISLAGIGSTYGGGTTYGADGSAGTYGGGEVIEVAFPIKKVGLRIEYHIFNNNVDEDFFISQLLTDFKPLSRMAS